MMASTVTQLGAYALGLAAVVGATVAVCLGKIDAPTYVSIVVAFGGVGVGAGVHAAGTSVPTVAPSVAPPPQP
jgi:hypothetical protein